WLVIMLVVMPLTSAGLFATALLDGTTAAVLGYLAVSLSYSSVLVLVRMWQLTGGRRERLPTVPEHNRRSVLTLIGGAGLAYVATYASGLLHPSSTRAPSIMLVDPQEPVPSGGIDPPNPHPQAISSPVAEPQAPT